MDKPWMIVYLETLAPSLAEEMPTGQFADRIADPRDPHLGPASDLPADAQAAINACLQCDLPDCQQSTKPRNCRLAYVLRGVSLADVPPPNTAGRAEARPRRQIPTGHLLSAIAGLEAQEKRATVRAVAYALDVPVTATYDAICRAIDEGMLNPVESGRKSTGCSLTPAGRAQLAPSR